MAAMADTDRPADETGEHDVAHLLGHVHEQLQRVEKMMAPELAGARVIGREVLPAWRRASRGELRIGVTLAVAAAIGLQVALPGHYSIHPFWLMPSLEGALGIGLLVANPTRIDRASSLLRSVSILLIALISLANGWSSALLINDLIHGRNSDNASLLLARGACVYLTNILVFALWYWEWDRGGPVARAHGRNPYPDFLFPQMTQPGISPEEWEPMFLDYLYVSFTNATAFSPTDTMPLARWAKMLMLLQSTVALLTIGLIIARAINVLK